MTQKTRRAVKKSDVPHNFFVTQSFLLGYSGSSDNITVINKKNTSKNESTIVSEITK